MSKLLYLNIIQHFSCRFAHMNNVPNAVMSVRIKPHVKPHTHIRTYPLASWTLWRWARRWRCGTRSAWGPEHRRCHWADRTSYSEWCRSAEASPLWGREQTLKKKREHKHTHALRPLCNVYIKTRALWFPKAHNNRASLGASHCVIKNSAWQLRWPLHKQYLNTTAGVLDIAVNIKNNRILCGLEE